MEVVGDRIMKKHAPVCTNSNLVSRTAKLAVAALMLSLFVVPAQAAKFGVRVVDGNGAAIVGAAVCIGLQGNYKQFAATFTDAQGKVMVEVPNVPLLVTISKDRFTGMRTTEPARSFNLLKQVTLRDGVPGPRCRAGSSMAEHKPGVPSIVLTAIAIEENTGSKTLKPTVSGEPNQYRVSSSKAFENAKWKQYANKIALAESLSNSEKVYLQMRKILGSSSSQLETRSEVLTVRLIN